MFAEMPLERFSRVFRGIAAFLQHACMHAILNSRYMLNPRKL